MKKLCSVNSIIEIESLAISSVGENRNCLIRVKIYSTTLRNHLALLTKVVLTWTTWPSNSIVKPIQRRNKYIYPSKDIGKLCSIFFCSRQGYLENDVENRVRLEPRSRVGGWLLQEPRSGECEGLEQAATVGGKKTAGRMHVYEMRLNGVGWCGVWERGGRWAFQSLRLSCLGDVLLLRHLWERHHEEATADSKQHSGLELEWPLLSSFFVSRAKHRTRHMTGTGKCWKKGRKKMLEGRDWEKRDPFIDLEAISRQMTSGVDNMAHDEHIASRPQDKVLGIPRCQGLEKQSV